MNKLLLSTILIFVFALGEAQVGPDRYLVFFNDKTDTPYSIDDPEEFLSQRAIERRILQNIDITETDLPLTPEYVQQVNDIENVTVLYRLKWFNAVLIETADSTLLDSIEALPFVDRYEREKYFSADLEGEYKPLPPRAKNEEDYGPSLNQIEMLNGVYLHEEGFKGSGKIIAVFDAGYSRTNEDAALSHIYGNGLLMLTKDFIDGDNNVYHSSSHGSYVLSSMAGILIDSLIGTSPESKYALFRTENVNFERRVEEANWAAAAEYADSMGADVINSSLGYTTFDLESESYTYADMDGETTLISRAAQIASERGILVVTSAGNSGNGSFHYIGAPGDAPGVLTVGSVNSSGNASSFSSRGPSFDGRVKPNVMAQGQASVLSNTFNGIFTANGTSFSSPILAGMATSLWSKYPEATSVQIFQAIEQSASLYGNPNDSMGYGIPDFAIADQLLSSVSVNEYKGNEFELDVFPNPFSKILKIQFQLNTVEDISVRIIDIRGKILYQSFHSHLQGPQFLQIDPGNELAAGIYLVQISSASGLQTQKLILKTAE